MPKPPFHTVAHLVAVSPEILEDAVTLAGLIQTDLSASMLGLPPRPSTPEPVNRPPLRAVTLLLAAGETVLLQGRCACGHLIVVHNTDDIGDLCPLCECTHIRHQPPGP